MGRTSGSRHGISFCLEKEMTRCQIAYCSMDWQMVKELETAQLEIAEKDIWERSI